MADSKQTTDLGLLEEDDEFEEFPKDEVVSDEQDQNDIKVWEDKWDDDDTAQVKTLLSRYFIILSFNQKFNFVSFLLNIINNNLIWMMNILIKIIQNFKY